jgi:hypothetical protein
MPIIWNDIIITQPVNGQLVWIRRLLLEVPTQATWTTVAQTFTTAAGLTLPWYMVSKWRVI